MNNLYKIYGDDYFLKLGFKTLLKKANSTTINKFESHSHHRILNFYLVPNASSLTNVRWNYDIDLKALNIVICPMYVWEILKGTNVNNIEMFIDISMIPTQIEHAISQILSMQKENKNTLTPSGRIMLTSREKLVLKYLSKGMRGSEIASMFNLSSKTISSQKRSLMKKLYISNNFQLFMKSRFLT